MTVLMFQKRFAEPILSGRKRQTIRPPRKRPIKPGDELSLRVWQDKPYRSNQVELWAVRCSAVFSIDITRCQVFVAGTPVGTGQLGMEALDDFARGDGFDCWAQMLDYLESPGGYGLPFSGVVIQWEVAHA